MNVLKEIENKRRHKDACGLQSFIDCPKCDGLVHFYYSKFAGIEWAVCSTKNCFNYKKKKTPTLRKKPKLVLRKKPKLKRKQFTLL